MSLEKLLADAGFKETLEKSAGVSILMDEGYYLPVTFSIDAKTGEKVSLIISVKGTPDQLAEVKKKIEAHLQRMNDNLPCSKGKNTPSH